MSLLETYYTSSHEWISVEGSIGTVGITPYAHQELGDIVYVDLPKVGTSLKSGEAACVLESTKAAVDVYAPMSGRVIAVNGNPNHKEADWLFRLEIADVQEAKALLSHGQYTAMLTK